MNKYLVILLALCSFMAQSCGEKVVDELNLQFTETQCNNPWETLPDQGNYLVEVRKYLVDAGVNVVSLTVDFYELEATCTACTCPTGRYIVIRVPVSSAKLAESIGFILIE